MAKLSLTTNPEKADLINTGDKIMASMKMTDLIKISDPFKSLFPIRPDLLDTITQSIKESGFDRSQPLILWKETGILLDGHTRLEAAKRVDMNQVPVCEISFPDEQTALKYVIHLQKDRRNLTDAELFACILELDKRNIRGGDRKSEESKSSTDLFDNKPSREVTADIVGTSGSKVQKVRAINDSGIKEIKEKVKTGDLTINKAYEEVKKQRPPKAKKEDSRPKTKKNNLERNSSPKGSDSPSKVERLFYEGDVLYYLHPANKEKQPVLEFKVYYDDRIKDSILTVIKEAMGIGN